MLHIDGIEQPLPRMPRVVALYDVLAPIVQIAVAQQKSQPAQAKVILVIALDRVRYHRNRHLVLRPVPAISRVVGAGLHRLIDFGIGEGLVLPLIPSETPEHAKILRQLLLRVVAESILERAVVLVFTDARG